MLLRFGSMAPIAWDDDVDGFALQTALLAVPACWLSLVTFDSSRTAGDAA